MADIVLPATTTLERDDIGYATREPLHDRHEAGASTPVGEARDDYAIFAELAETARRAASLHRRPRRRCSGCAASVRRVPRERRPSAGVALPDVRRVLGGGAASTLTRDEPRRR